MVVVAKNVGRSTFSGLGAVKAARRAITDHINVLVKKLNS
jgi:hypothetical protein